MQDIVISLGGTGAPAFTGDVAIRAGRIGTVGGKLGPARPVVEAGGHAENAGIRPGRLVLAGR